MVMDLVLDNCGYLFDEMLQRVEQGNMRDFFFQDYLKAYNAHLVPIIKKSKFFFDIYENLLQVLGCGLEKEYN